MVTARAAARRDRVADRCLQLPIAAIHLLDGVVMFALVLRSVLLRWLIAPDRLDGRNQSGAGVDRSGGHGSGAWSRRSGPPAFTSTRQSKLVHAGLHVTARCVVRYRHSAHARAGFGRAPAGRFGFIAHLVGHQISLTARRNSASETFVLADPDGTRACALSLVRLAHSHPIGILPRLRAKPSAGASPILDDVALQRLEIETAGLDIFLALPAGRHYSVTDSSRRVLVAFHVVFPPVIGELINILRGQEAVDALSLL